MDAKKELAGICPTTFREAWAKYPKRRHLTQASNVLDFQNFEWAPFKDEHFHREIKLYTGSDSDAKIYINANDDILFTESVICKGELKRVEHYDSQYNKILPIIGVLELKIAAFVSTYFKRTSCIITTESVGDYITGISLLPNFEYINSKNDRAELDAIIKLYKRRMWID